MKTMRLMLPLFAVTLGACSTYTPTVTDDQSAMLGQKVSGKAKADKSMTALTIEPTTRITNGVPEDQAAYLMGKSMLSEGQTDAAIDSFANALSINPKMVDAYVGIGIAQSMANRQALAIAAFDEAVRLEPSSAQWRANLGMAFARNGDFQRANTELSKAWAMAPANKRIEAQYERVAETARLERIVAEQAAARQASIDASGMTVITGDDVGKGMRRVSKRVYELDLEPKLALATTTNTTTNTLSQPAGAAMPTAASASLPPLVSAESVEPMPEAKASETAVVEKMTEKVAAPMLPPAVLVTETIETQTLAVESVVTNKAPKAGLVTASAEKAEATEIPANDLPVQTMVDSGDKPVSLSAKQVAKAEAEISREAQPAIVQARSTPKEGLVDEVTPADVSDEQQTTPAPSVLSRDEALEIARQRLFERKLERARIRAARTALIGLEDQAKSNFPESSSAQR